MIASLTGFGPFPGVPRNSSAELVELLAEGRPDLRATVLPVEFGRAEERLARHVAGLERRPELLVATGVHRGESLRLELRARRVSTSLAPDASGRVGTGSEPDAAGPPERATTLDVVGLAEAWRQRTDLEVIVSDDAGGYLCERVYYATLGHAEALGVPGLFVHVPGVDKGPAERLVPAFRTLLDELIVSR